MKNAKMKKRALLTSLLALFLCCTMLVGTTFAWFTDSVESGINKIVAGNLDVEVYDIDENKKVDANHKLFDEATLWEPGKVIYKNIKVVNEGTLALKYRLMMDVIGENYVVEADDKETNYKLSDVVKIAILDEKIAVTGTEEAQRKAVLDMVGDNFGDFSNTNITGTLYPKDKGTSEQEYGIVLYWEPGDDDNNWNLNNGKYAYMLKDDGTIDKNDTSAPLMFKTGLSLVATQVEYETDSFGPNYDKFAEQADVIVSTTDELAAALTAGHKLIGINGQVDLHYVGNDTYVTGAILVGVTSDAQVTFTGNGTDPVDVGLENLTVVDKTCYTYENGEYAWEFTYLELTGSHTYKNVVFTDGVMFEGDANITCIDCSFAGHNNDSSDLSTNAKMYGVWVANGNVTFENCVFSGTRGLKIHEAYGTEIGSVTVDACTFEDLTEKPGIAIGDLNAATTVTVKNSYFINCQAGDQDKYMYESDTDVTTFTFVDENNIISTKATVKVTDAASLASALTAAGLAGAGNTFIELDGSDIDLTGQSWTPVKVDGYNGADIITIDGNGATITGLTAPLFAGGFAGGSGIVIKNLTIADSNIVSTNTLGSGAFIESVDSMKVITLENCHLLNSTVTGGNGSRTGGLIGWTAGYNNVNDGPVKTYVTIKNCSVIGNTITCSGSVGGIYGHAGNNAWTYSLVEDCIVKNNTLTSNDDGYRVGVVVGTANVGELTINNITESDNTLIQNDNGTEIARPAGQSNLYGRFVPGTTGTLTIDGVAIH
ncbi:MAG: hypothetical protein IJA85_08350 [Clostridia bacterium]|nr:hypothetical protein [Clostridia bacterium]